MVKSRKPTTNTTLLRLKGTPFKSAAELKFHEDQLLRDEWQSVERARIRRELLMKAPNQKIISPFLNGFKANFVGSDGTQKNLLKVYMTPEESIHVDIDEELRSNDSNATVESLVKSLVEGFMGGYLTALGLKDEGLFKAAKSTLAEKKPIKSI